MKTIDEKLAKSLSAESTEIIPYFPYLLQDLWELGSSPRDIIEMIDKYVNVSKNTKILDLACGKGAVSVKLAKHFGCMVKGIDIIPEFIDYANNKAQEFGVQELCEFVVGNITEFVKTEKNYDIVILGAVGDVLGNSEETITLLKNTIKKNGYIIIDDTYGNDEDANYPTRGQWLTIFNNTGVKLIDEKIIEDDEIAELNNEQQEMIIKRANELKEKLPEKAYLFDRYIQNQQEECEELESDISGVTMLLQYK